MLPAEETVSVPPMDQFNQTLISNVHPENWVNPEPATNYHLVVIGAGKQKKIHIVTAGKTDIIDADEIVDRAIVDGETDGFVKVHVKKGTDEILGATIVARHAGEMISEITLAMVAKVGLGTIAQVIHPYPTQAEAIKNVADACNRTRLTPTLKKLFSTWISWKS